MRVLLLTKDTPWCRVAESLVRAGYPNVEVIRGVVGEPLLDSVRTWRGDLLISYLCPWVVPAEVLNHPGVLAVNFHPAPPEYRGFAPYSWAIYHGASRYGITVHQMTPQLDAGPILHVTRFTVNPATSVWALQQRTLLTLLGALMNFLSEGLTDTGEMWSGPVRTKADLEALRVITPELSQEEIRRREQAITYPGQPGLILTGVMGGPR